VTAPTLPCCCQRWGYDDQTCVCEPAERWARNLIARKAGTPPLDEATRREWASAVARVEGYPTTSDTLGLPDRDLAKEWMDSMADYCRDKGLLP
jgi:hypothetical protein